MKTQVFDAKSIGAAIRERRKASKIRIDDAAAICGMSVSTLSAIENGTRSAGIDKILLIATRLGLKLYIGDSDDFRADR